MAITILPQEQSLGGQLGQAAGSGLSGLLQGLAQDKAKRLEQQSWQDVLGVSPQEAQSLSMLPQPIQQQIVKDWWQRSGNQQPSMQGAIDKGISAEQANMQQAAQQQIQQQQLQQPSTIAQRLSTPPLREQREAEKLDIKKSELELKRQERIEKQNAPFIKEIREQVIPAKRTKNIIDDIKDILQDPEVNLGTISSFAPSFLQNEPTQKLVAKLNELVSSKLQNVKGVPNKLRTALEQAAKPSIWQKPGTVKSLLETMEKGLSEIITKNEIKDYFIESNRGEQPKGLESKVVTLYKKTKHLDEPASDFHEGTIVTSKGKQYMSTGNIWLPIEEV